MYGNYFLLVSRLYFVLSLTYENSRVTFQQSKFNEKEAQLQAANEQLVKEKKEQSAAADKEIKRRLLY
jgi:hypothetical protein